MDTTPSSPQAEENAAYRLFALQLARLGVSRLLDIASDAGRFGRVMRQSGYGGVIYSVEPRLASFLELVECAADDMRWLPLIHQQVGERSGLTDGGPAPVVVTATGDLLDPQIMGGIEALRIDAPGDERAILDGNGDGLKAIRLLLVKTAGADLADYLVKERGFAALPVAPAGLEEPSGERRDQVYWRPEASRQPPAGPAEVTIGAVVTSIGGEIHRPRFDGVNVGPQWRNDCAKSWRALTGQVFSVSESPPGADGVTWLETASRPGMAELIRQVEPHTDQHVLLINSDIHITRDFTDLLPELSPDTVYCGRRHEVGHAANGGFINSGFFEWGFDYFILPPAFVRAVNRTGLFPDVFLIGEPWWDYVLPILALALGFPVKKLGVSRTLGAHYAHEAQWPEQLWLQNGERVTHLLNQLRTSAGPHAQALLAEFAAPRESLQAQLECISRSICQGLP